MKNLCLGTALWGWAVGAHEAYSILDLFYSNGGRSIDTAYNYPINSVLNDSNAAEKILSSWIKKNRVNDLKVIYKIGSIENSNSCINDLSPSYLRKSIERTVDYLEGDNIGTIMIHWDNRDSLQLIQETLVELKKTCEIYNCRNGLSGIKYPELYFEIMNGLNMLDCDIEVKSNFIQRDEVKYKCFGKSPRFWAYGISGSGLKLNLEDYASCSYVKLVRDENYHENVMTDKLKAEISEIINQYPQINGIYDFSMLFSELNENLYGYIISPSSTQQMSDSIKFRENLQVLLHDSKIKESIQKNFSLEF